MISRTAVLAFCLAILFQPPLASAQDKLTRTELTAVTNELRLVVDELRIKGEQMQVQNADLALQVRELEGQNAQLTGRIETLQFQLGQSRDEVTRMQGDDQEIGRELASLESRIADLDARLARREQVLGVVTGPQLDTDGNIISGVSAGPGIAGAAPTGSISPSSVTAGQPSGALGTIAASDLPGEAGPLFADAKARLLQFDYKGAERSFKAFLARFGDDEQAGEAQYWLGEVLHQQKSYADSGAAYRDMIRNFPADPRAPDALVKLGRSLRLVGNAERACAVLATLPSRYPEASPVTRRLADVERSRSSCEA